jgi:hypothetical protein
MPRRSRFASIAALLVGIGPAIACDSDTDRKAAEVTGTITIGGKPANVASCKATPGPGGAVLRIELDGGLVLVADPASGMHWQKGGAGGKLDCTRVASKQEAHGARSKGDLALTCTHPDGKIVADLHVDCGES